MSEKLTVLADAPDFELTDTHGSTVRLSDYHGKQEVVLVLLRGFT
jgi:peroxiredoxin